MNGQQTKDAMAALEEAMTPYTNSEQAIKTAIYLYAEKGNPNHLTEQEFKELQYALRVIKGVAV